METGEEFYTIQRARILNILKTKKDMTQASLEDELKISRGAIVHHLRILKKFKLINFSKPKERLKGDPTLINITNKADPQTQKMISIFGKVYSTIETLKRFIQN